MAVIEAGNVHLPMDQADGLISELQNLSSQINKTIKSTKTNAAPRLLCAIGLIVSTIIASINIAEKAHSFKTTNCKRVKNDKWNVDKNMIITNYTNCTSQYNFGYEIRFSFCNTEQYGNIVDIRHFFNNHSKIKGINLPYKDAVRMVAVMNKQS